MSTETPHDRWVREGNCPVISLGRSWCGHKAGHTGLHGSPLVTWPGKSPLDVCWVEWDK